VTTIWYMGFPLRSGVHLLILYVTTGPIITCYLIWRWLLKVHQATMTMMIIMIRYIDK
jgi:hypothetical protein